MALKLKSVSINKSIAPEYITVKVSQDLNLKCKICQHSEIDSLVGMCQK